MSIVSLVKCPGYGSPGLEAALERALAPLGGMAAFVRPGQRVLIKPNMLGAYAPERQVTTHPALVLAVGRLALAAGGRVTIADSPALEPFARVAAKTGLAQAAAALGAEIRELSEPTPAPAAPGAVFKGLQLARLALTAEVIINLPKLKTHGQMLLTLGVKNLFGTVVAQRKSEWHLVAGVDRPHFADLLLDIQQTLKPALTILDGVWGMEGRGPWTWPCAGCWACPWRASPSTWPPGRGGWSRPRWSTPFWPATRPPSWRSRTSPCPSCRPWAFCPAAWTGSPSVTWSPSPWPCPGAASAAASARPSARPRP
jgi:uncharacterized protein (DUF362 family)